MGFLRHIIGLVAALLFSAFSAMAMPVTSNLTSQAEFFPQQNVTFAEHKYVQFTARAPPLAAANVGVTGGVTVMQGSAFALHGQETVAALFGFDANHLATNTAGEVITGARTLSRMDAEGWDLAEDFYEQMRRSGGSVDDIAQNTGLSRGAVERAYRHLFLDRHQLDDGLRRFDADPEIVNAWNRMRSGTHTAADIDLVNHERFEAILMQRYGQPYRCAHAKANACGFQSPIDN